MALKTLLATTHFSCYPDFRPDSQHPLSLTTHPSLRSSTPRLAEPVQSAQKFPSSPPTDKASVCFRDSYPRISFPPSEWIQQKVQILHFLRNITLAGGLWFYGIRKKPQKGFSFLFFNFLFFFLCENRDVLDDPFIGSANNTIFAQNILSFLSPDCSTSGCQGRCGVNSTCFKGYCFCDVGWTGDNCTTGTPLYRRCVHSFF